MTRRQIMRISRVTLVAALAIASVTAGCTTYYRVTDPASGRKYYTDEVKRSNGSARFKDHVTGAEVNLPASEVLEVKEDEYKKATGK
jgi:hypothetical protein